MQQLNELKNLVMQNLEKNGYLSNIRAQIRASVFKTIDNQQSTNKVSPFYSENTKLQKMAQSPEGQNALQLIKELMQTYSMEHSTNIFSSQANLKSNAKRQALQLKNRLEKVNPNKPLLLQILQKFTKNKQKVQKKQLPPKIQAKQFYGQQDESQGQVQEDIIKNESKKFGQSEEFGQSQGYDITVDSIKLEQYDYYEEI